MIEKKGNLGLKFDKCKIVNDNEGTSELPYYNVFDIPDGESITEYCVLRPCRLRLASIAEALFKGLLVLAGGESSLF